MPRVLLISCISRWVLVCLGPILFASIALAADTEVREFAVEVDGKASGQNVMTITVQDDGVESVRNVATVTFKHLFGTYRYSFQGVEHWKGGRVFQLNGSCNDDGTKTEVSAALQGESLRLNINGRERNCRADVWTTSYWKIPAQQFHNTAVPLLDADTGKEMVGQLKYVGVEAHMISGQQQNCHHFRVTGGPSSPIDLWYDGNARLIRQEYTEQGRRVVVVLRTIRRG
jgi:hypothetical protein